MFWLRTLSTLSLCACAVRANLVDDIVDAIESAVTCTACHALLVPMAGVAVLGDSAFSDTLIEVCKIVGVEDDDVCEGIIGEQGPIVAHVLRSINPLGQTATKLCNSLLGLCQQPDVNDYTVPFPKAAPTNPKVWVSKGRAPFQVSHFSDVHIDRSYTPGADVDCTKPICCRDYADSPATPTVPAGLIGAHNCDTSTKLIQSMLKTLPTTNKFNIFTGDVVEASVWLVNQSSVTYDLKTFNNEMATLLKTPIYPVIAKSHPSTSSRETLQIPLMPPSGSLTPKPRAGRNGSMPPVQVKSPTSPEAILLFIPLQDAEDAGQRAWIIGHMPPGLSDCLNDQSNYFNQVVQRYKNTIAAQFYGHSHQDQFEIAYSDYDNRNEANAVSVAWIAPSITPRPSKEGNPAFKTYDIDPDTYEVMDAHVYYSDMASSTFQTSPAWTQYYSVRSTWGSLAGAQANEPLNAAFWHRVTELFESNDAAFQQYNTFLNRGYNIPSCDADCKEQTICGLRAMRAENNCQTASPGLNFHKRDGKEARHHRELKCEGAALDTIMSQLPSLVSNPTFNVTALKVALSKIIGDSA
ncbi:hypothetical protein C0995_003956 [Termitomyces sp. Mi166|nr:hypothetical protein C0995_003956 [Termitomyces sp. Mi166\